MSEPLWRPSLPWLWHVLLFNEALAIPIALMTVASGFSWKSSFIGASTYTQMIGSLCFLGGALMQGRCETLVGPRRLALSLLLNTILALIGGALAAFFLNTVFGYGISGQSMLLKLATGASVALLVTIGKMSSHQLRIALEISEQSLRERELAHERLQKAKSEAELAALQARINPHFLFNTLNSIAALIGDDPAKAEQVLGQLSSLMRYALQSNRSGVVTVDEELTIVRGYLEIEQVRLGARLHYEIDVDPALRNTELPVLLLQPLVENAIKHGIAPKVAGGRVTVRGWRSGDDNSGSASSSSDASSSDASSSANSSASSTGSGKSGSGESGSGKTGSGKTGSGSGGEPDAVIFTITDDGDGGDRETAGTGEGLANVRQRLEALYGSRASVTLTRHDGVTETRVTLPATKR